MSYVTTAIVLGILIGIVYLYQVFSTLENSIRESHNTSGETAISHDSWQKKNTFDYKVLSSIIGSTLLIFLLSVSPVFWWLIPFAGLAGAVGVIIAFIIDKRSAQ